MQNKPVSAFPLHSNSMDLQAMVNESMKRKAILFAQWLKQTYHGDIAGLDFEKQFIIFEKWYAAEQARKALQKVPEREY